MYFTAEAAYWLFVLCMLREIQAPRPVFDHLERCPRFLWAKKKPTLARPILPSRWSPGTRSAASGAGRRPRPALPASSGRHRGHLENWSVRGQANSTRSRVLSRCGRAGTGGWVEGDLLAGEVFELADEVVSAPLFVDLRLVVVGAEVERPAG
jgi:hypothetical protein